MEDILLNLKEEEGDTALIRQGRVDFLDLVAPDSVEKVPGKRDVLVVGGKYVRGLMVAAYPNQVALGWLNNFYRLNKNYMVAFHVYPTLKHQMLRALGKQQVNSGSSIESARRRQALADIDDVEVYEDAEVLRRKLARGDSKMFYLGFYIGVEGLSIEELERETVNVEAELHAAGMLSKRAMWQPVEAFKSLLPLGTDYLQNHHTFTTEALSSLNPFGTPSLFADEGIVLGLDAFSGALLMVDPIRLQNSNINILAMSGAGKTFFIKMFLAREYTVYRTKVIIIDPEDEYAPLTRQLGGETIRLSFDSPHRINPFDLVVDQEVQGVKVVQGVQREGVLGRKLDWLMGLYRVMLGPLSPAEKGLLERVTEQAYASKGIDHSTASMYREGNFSQGETIAFGKQLREMPTLADVQTILALEPGAERLADGFWRWVQGSVNFFNCQTNVRLDSDFTTFVIKDMVNEEIKTAAAYVITGFCWSVLAKRGKVTTRIIIDEAHLLMKYQETGEMMEKFARQCRKYGAGLVTVSQNIEEFLSSPSGRAVATNSAIQVLFRQHDAAINLVAQQFKLTEFELDYLRGLSRGECLLSVLENQRRESRALRVVASQVEAKLYSAMGEG
ncbi:MAG: ATP-binding protein [Carboxydocellales bacterium]